MLSLGRLSSRLKKIGARLILEKELLIPMIYNIFTVGEILGFLQMGQD
jgi:hypothetical protein